MHGHHAPEKLIDHAGRALGSGLTLGFVVAKAVVGIPGRSLVLLADAAHNSGKVGTKPILLDVPRSRTTRGIRTMFF